MTDLIPVCPECDSSTIRNVVGKHDGAVTPDSKRCGDCYAVFEDPEYREKKHDHDTNSERTQALLDYDCEVLADD